MAFVLANSEFIYTLSYVNDIISVKYVRPGELHYVYGFEFKPTELADMLYLPYLIDYKLYFRGLMIDPAKHEYAKRMRPNLTFPRNVKLAAGSKAILKDVQDDYCLTETPYIKFEIWRLEKEASSSAVSGAADVVELPTSPAICFKSDQFINFEHVLLCGQYALIKCTQYIPGIDYIKEMFNCTGFIFGYDLVKFE